MKRSLIALIALLFVISGCGGANGNGNADTTDVTDIQSDEKNENTDTNTENSSNGEIVWHTDWNQALADAEAQDKLIMLDIYTDWCEWCHELDKRTYTHGEVIEASKEFINIKLNPETQEEGEKIARMFQVQGYPAILFLDSDMNLVWRIGGFLEGEPFAAEMKSALSTRGELMGLLEGFENGDQGSLEKLIDLYLRIQREEDAVQLIIDNKPKGLLPEKALYEIAIGYHYLDNENYTSSHDSFDKAVELADKGSEDYYHAAYMKGYMMYYSEMDGAIEYLTKVADEDGNTFKDAFMQLIDQLGVQ